MSKWGEGVVKNAINNPDSPHYGGVGLHQEAPAVPTGQPRNDNGAISVPDVPEAATDTLEHDEQVMLFEWIEQMRPLEPALYLAYAIPNGGHRFPAVAAMLKAEGVTAGVPDICIAVPRGKWHSLYIELKRRNHSNRPTKLQEEWIERLNSYNNMAVVCYGCNEAQQAITTYLQQE